ncbi:MAG: hypothetical protein L3J35_02005 [Bacteroidales bacterium]|nr:hypothetical protein [Bacteroidales bacterium]
MKQTISIFLTIVIFAFVSCGDGNSKKANLSEKGELLTSVTWKYDTNASIKGTTDDLKDTTGITADIELKDDVKAIGDFLTGTLRFGVDTNDPSKLSYERKYGKGIFSISTLGWWEFNEDETSVIMREWDDVNKKELPPETKQIVKLTKDQLILKEESGAEHFYIPQ